MTREPLIIHGDVATLHADHGTGRYFLYQKLARNHGLDMRRSWLGLESADAIHWEGYQGQATWRECFVADDYDDQFAASRGLRIADFYGIANYCVGDLYVALQSVFLIGDPLVQRAAQNPKGLSVLRLAYSHNAMNWRYPKGRPVWLEQGPPGDMDGGFMVMSSAFVDHGSHLWLYYHGLPYEHGWSINTDFSPRPDIPLEALRDSGRVLLARIRRDRFAALAAPHQSVFEVENTTRMELTSGRAHLDAGPRGGDALFVNARCPQGSVRVALMEQGKAEPLPGFGLEDCVPFTGDAVRGSIRYRQASIAQIPARMGLFLRFEVRRGEIYGYEWAAE